MIAIAVAAYVALFAAACESSSSHSSDGWPPFRAVFEESSGPTVWQTRIEYRGSTDWVVSTNQPGRSDTTVIRDADGVRHYNEGGGLLLESQGIVPALGDWGVPLKSAKELLDENTGWTRQEDGTLVKALQGQTECQTGSDCVAATYRKVYVRDENGIPVRYELYVDDELRRTVERIEFALE